MDQNDKLSYLFSLKPESITLQDVFRLFNKKIITTPSGVTSMEPPLFYPIEDITAPKGSLPSIKEDTKTTAGRYVFNLITVAYAYGDKWPYINYEVKSDQMEDLMNKMCDELLMGRITGEEYGKFQNRVVWINNFSEIFVPGNSISMIALPKEIRDELQRLIEENKECIINNDIEGYLYKIEKPILEFARKWYIDNNDPGWLLYAKGGKPSFDNNFKSMFLEVGPIKDIATGKFNISTANYADGIPPDEMASYTNMGIFGAYSRAVNTQYSGAKTKEFAVAFQSLVVTEEDCGSDLTIGIDVTKENVSYIKWRWIKDPKSPDGYTLLTPDNYKSYIGKHVEYRSPMLCKSDGLCWRCMGELYKRLGLKNAGLASQRLTSTFLNNSLKAMHDQTQKLTTIDWKKCVFEEE